MQPEQTVSRKRTRSSVKERGSTKVKVNAAEAEWLANYEKRGSNVRWSHQQDIFLTGVYPQLTWRLYEYNPGLVDTRKPPTPSDFFKTIKTLGSGHFGRVELVEVHMTGEVLAMKIQPKTVSARVREGELNCLITAGVSPFIVRYHSCFETQTDTYILLQYFRGTNFADVMKQHGPLEPHECRFFLSEACEGLFHLHRRGIIHRDIKLTNMMLGMDNHVKLCDLGLAKVGMTGTKKTNTRCGAIRYCAPEVMTKTPYSKEVDWWSLGVVMYQMLVCKYPFDAKKGDRDLLVLKIRTFEPDYSTVQDEQALDLLQSFLKKDGTERLGYGDNEEDDIRSHPFFRFIDWRKQHERRGTPPALQKRTMRRASIQRQAERQRLPKDKEQRSSSNPVAAAAAAVTVACFGAWSFFSE